MTAQQIIAEIWKLDFWGILHVAKMADLILLRKYPFTLLGIGALTIIAFWLLIAKIKK